MLTEVHNRPSPDASTASRVFALGMFAVALFCLGGVFVLATTACSTLFGFGSTLSLYEILLAGGSALTFATLGAVIAAYQPGNRIGWICGAIGVSFAFAQFGGSYANCTISGGAALPAAPLIAWLAYLAFPVTILLMFSLLPFLFPDGRLASPNWRRVALVTTALVVASLLLTAIVQGPLVHSGVDTNYQVDNPFGLLPATLGQQLENAVLLTLVAASVAGIASLAVRLRRSRGAMRQQLKLLLYFLAAAIAVQLAIELYGDLVDATIFSTWVYYLVLLLTFWGFPAGDRPGRLQSTGSTTLTSLSARRCSTRRRPRCWRCSTSPAWSCFSGSLKR
jgi:MFS family permease